MIKVSNLSKVCRHRADMFCDSGASQLSCYAKVSQQLCLPYVDTSVGVRGSLDCCACDDDGPCRGPQPQC